MFCSKKVSLLLMSQLAVAAVLAVDQPAPVAPAPSSPESKPAAGQLTMSKALVSLIDHVQIPARQAGVLKQLSLEDGTAVREGMLVQKGQVLGALDDEDATARKKAAEAEHRVAIAEQAKAAANIKASAATIEVAKAEVAASRKIREGARAAVSDQELRRQELTVTRAESENEVAQKESETAALTAEARQAQLEVASITVRHHQIVCPQNGVIVQIFRRAGEWVSPGDPILRVVYMDKLRVEGFVNADDYTPDQVLGRAVEVAVHLPNGRTERFSGVIAFVSPIVESSNDFRVYCEVENRQHQGYWLLRPGMTAEMSVNLQAPPAKVATAP